MKEDQKQPHNNFFVKQFSNLQLALSFFRNYLPADIVKAIDWSIFRQAPTDFVSKALKNRKSDIIYETRIKNQKCFFYLHLEHQRTSAPDMALLLSGFY